jgi:hypothetical protein
VCASGKRLPAYYITNGGSITGTSIPDEADEEGHIVTSDKGYTKDELCLEWLELHLDKYATSEPGRNRLLIVDSLESSKTEEFDAFCRERNIIL